MDRDEPDRDGVESEADRLAENSTGVDANDRDRSLVRRRLLQTIAATGTAFGLAGCSGVTERRYVADPVALAPEAAEFGFTTDVNGEFEVEREETVGGNELSITLVNYEASYDHEANPVGLAATPSVEEGGVNLSPVARADLSEIVNRELGGEYAAASEVTPGSEWVRGPELLDSSLGTMLDSEVDIETYVGITDEDELALVSAARAFDGGDAVFAGASRTRAVEPGTDRPMVGEDGIIGEAEVDDLVGTMVDVVLPNVVREGTDLDGTTTGQTGTSLEAVPIELHRLAAKHVAEADPQVAPGWEDASLTGEVEELYRPDVEGPAYYEFAVEPMGYVIVSTGRHDKPIPNWNHRRAPPSRRLREGGEDLYDNEGGEPTGFFKMDSLYFVGTRGTGGEYGEGERVAELNDRPHRVVGLDGDDLEPETATVTHGPTTRDVEPGEVELELKERSGRLEGDWELEEWESWSEMVGNYEESYGPLLDDLRQRAGEDWAVLEELEENGIGLEPEERREVPFLFEVESFDVEGTGQEFVAAERTQTPRNGGVSLSVESVPDGENRRPLELQISYENGQSESLTFVPVPAAATDPQIQFSGGAAHNDETELTGGYSTWYAGSAGDQREYQQFEDPSAGCLIGCGPVAWAMLYGWADVRADDGRSRWSSQSGLFRQNGDTAPASDIRAPNSVRRVNSAFQVCEELATHVSKFCIGDSGATTPWNMHDGWRFLNGRAPGRLWSWWNSGGVARKRCTAEARDQIKSRNTPSIIGTGWLRHYPLAWGYAYKSERVGNWPFKRTKHHRWFYVNNGWGNCCSEWVEDGIWYANRLDP